MKENKIFKRRAGREEGFIRISCEVVLKLASHPWNFHGPFFIAAVSRILIYPLNIRESLLINASNRHFDPFDSLYVFDHYSKGKVRIKKSST